MGSTGLPLRKGGVGTSSCGELGKGRIRGEPRALGVSASGLFVLVCSLGSGKCTCGVWRREVSVVAQGYAGPRGTMLKVLCGVMQYAVPVRHRWTTRDPAGGTKYLLR
eukprot:scaffold57095_cov30-Phaeocystis_antarctica.AAC.1